MDIFLKKISIILGIGFILTLLLSFASLWSLRQSSFYKPSFLVNTVKEKKFDYIILGASTGLTTLNTIAIDSVLNTTGVNLSMDDTSLASQYIMLEHFLAEGKSTDYCIIAPNNASFDESRKDLSDNDYRFLMYVNRPYVSDYYQNSTGLNSKILSVSKYFPNIGVAYYNAEIFYPSLLTFIEPTKRNRFDLYGNYTYPVISNPDKKNIERTEMFLSFKNPWLKRLDGLCTANKIQLIVYLSPMEATYVNSHPNPYKIINHSDLLINTTYFFDEIHVNRLGRQQASLAFAAEFKRLGNSQNIYEEDAN